MSPLFVFSSSGKRVICPKFKFAYFLGSRFVLIVCDCTGQSTPLPRRTPVALRHSSGNKIRVLQLGGETPAGGLATHTAQLSAAVG